MRTKVWPALAAAVGVAVAGAAGVVATAFPSGADAGGAAVTVVADGLDNPRQLTFGPGGLWVAEAGHGGAGPCFTASTGPVCAGTSGAVTLIAADGTRRHVVEGLPSFAPAGGSDATGPHGLTVADGQVFVTIGGPTSADRDALEAAFPEGGLLGWVGKVDADAGAVVPLVDAWRFETARNPDLDLGDPAIDSNVVDVVVDGLRLLFVDAGDNTLSVAREDGRIVPLSVFADRLVPSPTGPPGSPPVRMESVPTAVERGRDGADYVTEYTGSPSPIGAARVIRVDPVTGAQTVFATGFTNLVDLAFDAGGNLYVLEHDVDGLGPGTDGGISRVTPSGAVQRLALPPGTLTRPVGITVGPDGALYVTNRATTAGAGQVLRIAG
jgi:hypothetical protein